ncbi:MAG: hypothetical protein CSA04_06155, partial [Bacteroidetes bacterium]
SLSLSGGEVQRLRLATQLGAKLTGITYILDEPTIGLHRKNVAALLEVLRELADNGNTLLVVEHDKSVMRAADYLIDMGPGAGAHGGEVVFWGTPQAICEEKDSLTGHYLRSDLCRPSPLKKRQGDEKMLWIEGATAHNLKNLSIGIPVGLMTVITGVSGSGKSSLMHRVVYDSYSAGSAVNCSHISGFEHFDEVVRVEQQVARGTGGSMLLSRVGLWDPIRALFAATPEAKAAGLKKGDFSINGGKGRCDKCRGSGVLSVTMDFLSDVEKVCPACGGLRFKPEVLAVRYGSVSMGELLQMNVSRMLALFSGIAPITAVLQLLVRAGLGYLQVGQRLVEMSGGERQRVDLVRRLSVKGRALFLLDEPATGLHYADVEKLLVLLGEILEKGHTLLVISHNEQLMGAASRLIELGPGGGEEGGYVIAEEQP